jgi:hypothetical protein
MPASVTRWKPARLALLRRLMDSGLSQRQAATRLESTLVAVRMQCQKHGIKSRCRGGNPYHTKG